MCNVCAYSGDSSCATQSDPTHTPLTLAHYVIHRWNGAHRASTALLHSCTRLTCPVVFCTPCTPSSLGITQGDRFWLSDTSRLEYRVWSLSPHTPLCMAATYSLRCTLRLCFLHTPQGKSPGCVSYSTPWICLRPWYHLAGTRLCCTPLRVRLNPCAV